MRIQKQKRRLSKQNRNTLTQGFRQALGYCLTFVETICDRGLVSRHRLHKLTKRPKLRSGKSHQQSARFKELHPSSYQLKQRGRMLRTIVRLYPGGVFVLSLVVFLNNFGSDAYSWKFAPSFLNPVQSSRGVQLESSNIPPETLERLRSAIVQQESDGNYRLLNPSGSGAMGIGQVMPEDLPHWSQEALGREVSPEEFLNNHDLQVLIIDYKLNQYWQKAILQARGNEDETIMRIASWWYSGNPDLFTNTTPQSWNGDKYPSIAEYCHQILERYKAQESLPQVGEG